MTRSMDDHFYANGIYCIRNKINNKVYVGSSVRMASRILDHLCKLKNNKHPNSHLQTSWNKYGNEEFSIFVISYCERELLIAEEQYWIDWLDSYNSGYNQRPIAQAPTGQKMSPERLARHREIFASEKVRKAMSDGAKGKIISEEARKKISQSNIGKKRTPEQRARYSEAAKKRGVSQKFLDAAKVNQIGKKRSDEWKANISWHLSQRVISEETREKLRTARRATVERKRKQKEAVND